MSKLMKSVLTSVLIPAALGNQSYEVYSFNNEVTRISTDRQIQFVDNINEDP